MGQRLVTEFGEVDLLRHSSRAEAGLVKEWKKKNTSDYTVLVFERRARERKNCSQDNIEVKLHLSDVGMEPKLKNDKS